MWTLAVVWELDRARHLQASLAVAEERLRFSRDLHDVVGRTLSVVSLKAALAAQLSKRGRPEATDEMLEVRRIAEESLAELRAVVGGYRAAELDAELAGARALLASAGIRCHVSVSVRTDGTEPLPDPVAGGGAVATDGTEPLPGRVAGGGTEAPAERGDGARLPAEAQSAFGWVVREGTTNVLRHSEATTCTITLRVDGGTATLTMDNDGVTDTGPGGGTGIVGLTERITALGGTVTATHQPPDGFRLTARLPLARAAGVAA